MDENWRLSFRYIMMVMLVVVLSVVVWYIRTALGPLVIAALLAYLLNPIINFLERRRIPHSLATTLVLLVTLGLLGGLISFLVPVLVREFQGLILDLENMLAAVQESLSRPVQNS